jgi:hypothetical protein
MSETVERSSLDLRFEGYRLRDEAAEARLLASISERGIEEPLGGVDTPQGRVLLDGFRRNRCAAKLGIECVPYVCWGTDETLGIACLLGARRQRSLSILEQARFVDELLSTHQMTMADVAEMLSRSKAWVGARRQMLGEMSPAMQQILFRGRFPVYSYMVTLRPFMRMNAVGPREIERFVQALAGAKLSVREIDLLAHGYFRGPPALREAIDQGRWKWTLDQMQSVPDDSRRRTWPAAGTRAAAASHATRDDAVRQSAPAKPGLFRPGQSVTRRSVEPAEVVFQEDGGVL